MLVEGGGGGNGGKGSHIDVEPSDSELEAELEGLLEEGGVFGHEQMQPEELQHEQGEEEEQEEEEQPEQQLEEQPEQLVEAVQDVVEVSSDEGTMVQAPPRRLVQYSLKDFVSGKRQDLSC